MRKEKVYDNKDVKKKKEIVIKNAKKRALSVLPDGIDKPFGKELFFNPKRSVICSVSFSGAETSLEAEKHDEYADVFFVLSGEEELFIGGEISDASEMQKGEWKGKILNGARRYIVSANDIVIIPQGVPHRHGQGAMKFLVIKIKQVLTANGAGDSDIDNNIDDADY